MAKRTKWIAARDARHLSQLDACFEARADLPKPLWIDPSKLSRFENGGSAKPSPIALAALAKVYKKSLRQIDPKAADEYEGMLVAVAKLNGSDETGTTRRNHRISPDQAKHPQETQTKAA